MSEEVILKPDDTPEPPPKKKRKIHPHKVTAADYKFARLLFNRHKGQKSVVQCYREAGYPPHKTPEATLTAAHLKTKRPYFQEIYNRLKERAADAAQVDADLVTQALARVALFDIRKLFDERGRLRLPADWDDATAAAVLAIESDELFERVEREDPDTGKVKKRKELTGYTRKVKRVGPVEALKVLAQILRMIGPDMETMAPPPAPLVVRGNASPDNL